MPEPDGKLTDEEFKQAKEKLQALWPNGQRPACRSCGSEKHYYHPSLIGNISDRITALGPHTRMPSVMVYCQNCGLAEHYMTNVLGIEVLEVSDG